MRRQVYDFVVGYSLTGIAKDFEVIQGSPGLIVLPDEPLGPKVNEEDWENINVEDTTNSCKSYLHQQPASLISSLSS